MSNLSTYNEIRLEEQEDVRDKRRALARSLEELQSEIYKAERTDRSRLHSLKKSEQQIRQQLRLLTVIDSFAFDEHDDYYF